MGLLGGDIGRRIVWTYVCNRGGVDGGAVESVGFDGVCVGVDCGDVGGGEF